MIIPHKRSAYSWTGVLQLLTTDLPRFISKRKGGLNSLGIVTSKIANINQKKKKNGLRRILQKCALSTEMEFIRKFFRQSKGEAIIADGKLWLSLLSVGDVDHYYFGSFIVLTGPDNVMGSLGSTLSLKSIGVVLN